MRHRVHRDSKCRIVTSTIRQGRNIKALVHLPYGVCPKRAPFLSRKKSRQRKSRTVAGNRLFPSPASFGVWVFFFPVLFLSGKKKNQKESRERTKKQRHIRQSSLCHAGIATFSLLLFFFQKKKRKERKKKAGNGHKNKGIPGKAPSVTLVR